MTPNRRFAALSVAEAKREEVYVREGGLNAGRAAGLPVGAA